MTVPIGVQLYSLREEIQAQGADPVLKKLAETGFRYVESFGGLDAAELARVCKEYDLEVLGVHTASPVGDNQKTSLEMAETLGTKRIIEPWRSPSLFTSEDSIKQVADYLNEGAKVAAQHGLQLFYHNHWAEYEPVGDRYATQILLDYLDPSVLLELDTYWIKVGGQDPVEIVKSLGKRAPLLHIKDGPAVSREDVMTAAGEGVVDIPGIVKAGEGSAEFLIVELDRCATDMMEAVVKSFKYLTEKGFGHGR